jgi:hypothetical protein
MLRSPVAGLVRRRRVRQLTAVAAVLTFAGTGRAAAAGACGSGTRPALVPAAEAPAAEVNGTVG